MTVLADEELREKTASQYNSRDYICVFRLCTHIVFNLGFCQFWDLFNKNQEGASILMASFKSSEPTAYFKTSIAEVFI